MNNKELEFETIIYEQYLISNFIGLVDCIDHKNSNLDYYIPRFVIPDDLPLNMRVIMEEQETDNSIDIITHLILDESKIPEDIKIFRLKDCPRILVFKEEVVQAIKKAGLTGFVFIPIEEYTDEIPEDDDDDLEEEEEKIIVEEEEPELTEEQKAAKARYDAQQERSKKAYAALQERIRIRRLNGEGPSLV